MLMLTFRTEILTYEIYESNNIILTVISISNVSSVCTRFFSEDFFYCNLYWQFVSSGISVSHLSWQNSYAEWLVYRCTQQFKFPIILIMF
jgi:hypothetical protein